MDSELWLPHVLFEEVLVRWLHRQHRQKNLLRKYDAQQQNITSKECRHDTACPIKTRPGVCKDYLSVEQNLF